MTRDEIIDEISKLEKQKDWIDEEINDLYKQLEELENIPH